METNRHHVFFQRRKYKTGAERRLRNNPAFVIPMDVGIHQDLHANVVTPPKPDASLIHGILNNLENNQHRGLLDGVLFTIDYLDGIETKTAQRLSMNLQKQLGFLIVGAECERPQES